MNLNAFFGERAGIHAIWAMTHNTHLIPAKALTESSNIYKGIKAINKTFDRRVSQKPCALTWYSRQAHSCYKKFKRIKKI